MPYKTVAVAGATGNLGPTLVDSLVEAGFEVTVLSRSDKKYTTNDNISKVIKVDYTSLDSLTAALQGQDVVVSNLPSHDQQEILLEAAIAAGVQRFLPSEFGCNVSDNKNTAALPVFKDGKVPFQRFISERSNKISYTLIVTGLFLDWCLGQAFNVNLKGTSRVFDGGDTETSTTTLRDIGKAVVGVLKHPEETKNRAVHVQSAVVTQNELLAIAQKLNPSFKAPVKHMTIEQLNKEAYTKLEQGKVQEAMGDFILVGVFGKEYGGYWGDKNDNQLLGIKELSEKELEDVVAKYL